VFNFHVLRSRTVLDGTEGAGSCFHVLRNRTRCWRYRGRHVRFSRFTLPNPFSEVKRAPVLVFIFCAPILILGGIEGVGSSFHDLRSRTHFRRYRGLRVKFSCVALLLVLGGTECIGSCFHVFRFRSHFRRYQGHQFQFSCFALQDIFSAIPRVVVISIT
jgi:hypothetical protein